MHRAQLLAKCLLLSTIPLSMMLGSTAAATETLRVAVAANFKPTLNEVNDGFRAQTSHTMVKVSSGATGTLAHQIAAGAPFDLFFAADTKSVRQLRETLGLPPESAFCYAQGQLTLLGTPRLASLQDPTLSLAIANPNTAPYGRAAQEALAHASVRSGQNRKLVRGNNVAQAYQFWHSGAVDMALVSTAQLKGNTANTPAHTPIPNDWYAPIMQSLLILNDRPATHRYVQWLRSDRVRSLITAAGYQPCP